MDASYLHLPTEVTSALEALEQQIEREATRNRPADLELTEGRMVASLATVGRAVIKHILSKEDPVCNEITINGTQYKRVTGDQGTYLSMFGKVTVNRGRYRSKRNAKTICPMEQRTGIVEGFWTPKAAKVGALAIVDMTPQHASRFFAELHMMRPSKASLDRLPKALSRRWEAQRSSFEQRMREEQSIPPEAVTVAVSLDGVMVPMRIGDKKQSKARTRAQGRPDKGPVGYREVGCGTLSFYDVDAHRLCTRRFGRMPEPKKKTLKRQLRGELDYVLRQRPELKVVVVADGAEDNWSFLDSLPHDAAVVDFYHAAEHLKRALDTLCGATSVKTQQRFTRLRQKLRDQPDGAERVIRSLNRAKSKVKIKSKSAQYHSSTRYFKTHKKRMRYATLQAQNLPIGSGVIEGTCKSLASERLKRAGMRWDYEGGQAILTLRALQRSDRFDAAWQLLRGTYQADVVEPHQQLMA